MINWKRVWLIALIVYTVGMFSKCTIEGMIYG